MHSLVNAILHHGKVPGLLFSVASSAADSSNQFSWHAVTGEQPSSHGPWHWLSLDLLQFRQQLRNKGKMNVQRVASLLICALLLNAFVPGEAQYRRRRGRGFGGLGVGLGLGLLLGASAGYGYGRFGGYGYGYPYGGYGLGLYRPFYGGFGGYGYGYGFGYRPFGFGGLFF
ncbi:hypothetical protein ACF0H5_009664 [Mactra antiquata]